MENNTQKHKLILDKIHSSGEEEWYCPTCGRRFIMSWPPNYKKIVIEAGDEYAIHNGWKNDLSVLPMKTTDVSPTEMDPSEQTYLAPWLKWMEESNFASRWNDDI